MLDLVSLVLSWKISSNKGDFSDQQDVNSTVIFQSVFSSGQVWAWPPRGGRSQLILHHWTYFPVICLEKSLRKQKTEFTPETITKRSVKDETSFIKIVYWHFKH